MGVEIAIVVIVIVVIVFDGGADGAHRAAGARGHHPAPGQLLNAAPRAGVAIVMPFIDRMLPLLDMREQVVSFPPQPVITSDNVTINVTSVVYYQILDPKNATYQVANLLGRHGAVDADHAAQRDGRADPGHLADQPRPGQQRSCAWCWTR